MTDCYYQQQKSILSQLTKARAAIRDKYKLLKYGKMDFEKALDETFKPVKDPLEKLVKITEQQRSKPGEASLKKELKKETNEFDNSSPADDTLANDDDETLAYEDLPQDTEYESAYPQSEDDNNDSIISDSLSKYLKMVNQHKKTIIDTVYGVRKVNDTLFIGNSEINFNNRRILVNDKSYPQTEGLLELLFRKTPDQSLIDEADKQNYRDIIEIANVHKIDYEEDKGINRGRGKKFKIIAELLHIPKVVKTGDGIVRLPHNKIVRKNKSVIDYVYWDDPNELVERLRLLMAERSAGNNNHTNEINSIVEELYEAGIIY